MLGNLVRLPRCKAYAVADRIGKRPNWVFARLRCDPGGGIRTHRRKTCRLRKRAIARIGPNGKSKTGVEVDTTTRELRGRVDRGLPLFRKGEFRDLIPTSDQRDGLGKEEMLAMDASVAAARAPRSCLRSGASGRVGMRVSFAVDLGAREVESFKNYELWRKSPVSAKSVSRLLNIVEFCQFIAAAPHGARRIFTETWIRQRNTNHTLPLQCDRCRPPIPSHEGATRGYFQESSIPKTPPWYLRGDTLCFRIFANGNDGTAGNGVAGWRS